MQKMSEKRDEREDLLRVNKRREGVCKQERKRRRRLGYPGGRRKKGDELEGEAQQRGGREIEKEED